MQRRLKKIKINVRIKDGKHPLMQMMKKMQGKDEQYLKTTN